MLTGAVVASYVAPAIGFVIFTGCRFFVSLTAAALATAVLALVIERLTIRPMVGKAGVRDRDHHDRHRHRGPGGHQRLHRPRRAADRQPVGP